jgi:hypothetical protein
VLYYHHDRFKHLLGMMFFEMFKICVAFSTEAADVASDAVTFERAVVSNTLKGGCVPRGPYPSGYFFGGFRLLLSSFGAAAVVTYV